MPLPCSQRIGDSCCLEPRAMYSCHSRLSHSISITQTIRIQQPKGHLAQVPGIAEEVVADMMFWEGGVVFGSGPGSISSRTHFSQYYLQEA